MFCRYRVVVGAAAALTLFAAPAAAQVTNGQIHGVVTDQSGATVPGVTVTLEGSALIRPMVDVTVISGRYEFPIVPIGTYAVSFELTGFKQVVRPGVIIQTGFQAEVNVELEIGGLAETVEVSAAPPVVDTRQTSVGAVFTRNVMDQIPTPRDPWQIINMAAGIEANTVNVGSNQSGQQLAFTSRGQNFRATMWNVEGATVTDMAGADRGGAPSYFDFESFQEIQVTTGGGDASLQTSGININLVTRSGSNVFKGSGRLVYSDDNMQWQNVTEELFEQGATSGSPLKYYREWGAEAGGPLVRNQAWWWFAGARQDINGSVLGFFDTTQPECDPPPAGFEDLKANKACLKDDLTFIYNYNGKLNYQLNSSNKFQFLYSYSNKVRNARNARIDRAPESVYRQTSSGPGSFNFKHTWVATDTLVFDTLAQTARSGFGLLPQRGVEDLQRLFNRDTGFTSRGLYSNSLVAVRPTTEVKTDSSYFFSDLLGGDHTTKFGARYRNTPWQSDLAWTGHAEARISTRFAAGNPRPGRVCPTCALGPDRARLRRPSSNPTGLFTIATYLQDSYTRGRVRLNLGVRWDYQNDDAKAGCIDENPIVPDLLPAQCFEGADPGVTYSDISPRISATYDLLGTGKTVLKGGFARYYGQGVGLSDALSLLGPVQITFQNSASRTCWSDANGDTVIQRGELNLTDPRCIQYPSTFDPETQLRTTSLNEIDPNLQNNRTTEFTGGIEHELMPDFAVGVNYIYRLYDQFRTGIRIGETKDMWVAREWNQTIATAAGEPIPDGLPTAGWTYYEFDPTLARPPGITRTQNGAEDRRYDGVDLTATKRYSNRWMMHAAVTVQRRLQDPNFCFDCTNNDKLEGINDATLYIVKLNGMYAFPAGWNASANLQIQQGQNRQIFFDGPPSGFRSGGIGRTLGRVNFIAYDFGAEREPMVHLLDAQVTKAFDLRGGRHRLNLIFSVFNVLNANTVRSLNNDLNSTNFDRINTILAPRVARIMASVTF